MDQSQFNRRALLGRGAKGAAVTIGASALAAPRQVTDNPNFVKKVVFPLEAIAWSHLGAALFQLLHAARASGIQVLHTIIEALTKDGRDISLDHRLSNIFVPKGLPEGQPIKELTPIDNEIVLPKSSSGVFNSTNIDYVLKNLGIRYLIVSGVVTDQCVDMAVRDASDRGYLVTLAEGACATYSQERHDNTLRAIKGYCRQVSTEALTAEVERNKK